MDWNKLLKPTKGKVWAAVIIALAFFVSGLVYESFAGYLMPSWVQSEVDSKPMTEVVETHYDDFLAIGLKLMFLNAVIVAVACYLAACFVLNSKRR